MTETNTKSTELLTPYVYRNAIWDAMKALGVRQITTSFSGGGDSGQMDETSVSYSLGSGYDHDKWTAQNEAAKAYKLGIQIPANLIGENGEPLAGEWTLLQLVAHLSEEYVNNNDLPDWYNNDGGNGDVVWSEPHRTVVITVNQAQTTYDTTTHNIGINGEEEDEDEYPHGTCSGCGVKTDDLIGSPLTGREVCRPCFDAGAE